jgi:hypothetical protein
MQQLIERLVRVAAQPLKLGGVLEVPLLQQFATIELSLGRGGFPPNQETPVSSCGDRGCTDRLPVGFRFEPCSFPQREKAQGKPLCVWGGRGLS